MKRWLVVGTFFLVLAAGILVVLSWESLVYADVEQRWMTGRFPVASLHTMENRITGSRYYSFRGPDGELLRIPIEDYRSIGYQRRPEYGVELTVSTHAVMHTFHFERFPTRLVHYGVQDH